MPELQAARASVSRGNQEVRVAPARDEWERAAFFFKEVLTRQPAFAEARLRRGRVLSALGDYAEAAIELRTALSSLEDDTLRYYADMFLGTAEEGLGHFDAARDAYARARARFPRAQKPRLAISQIEFRLNRRQAAVDAIAPLFDPDPDPAGDPWTTYHISQARGADERLREVWQLVPAGTP